MGPDISYFIENINHIEDNNRYGHRSEDISSVIVICLDVFEVVGNSNRKYLNTTNNDPGDVKISVIMKVG